MDAMIDNAAPRGSYVDSLSANEFRIELDGEMVTGVFRVSGLVTFRLDLKAASTSKLIRSPFRLTRMVQRDPNLPFNRWLRETIAAGDDIVRPTRTIAIIAVDDGVETRRWTVKGAYIIEVSYSEFDTGSGELVEETTLIEYETLEETWALLNI